MQQPEKEGTAKEEVLSVIGHYIVLPHCISLYKVETATAWK